MTLSKSYERAVRDYLTDRYGATVLASDAGGKHRRLRFEHCGRPYVLTLASSPRHDERSAISMKMQDIRRLLGPPSDRPTATAARRTMEDMMPLDSASEPLPLPPSSTAVSSSTSCDGRMAYYSPNRLRFYVSAAFAAAMPDGPYLASRVGMDMWELHPDKSGRHRLVKAGVWRCLEFNVPNLDLGPFGSTPARYVLVDGHVLVDLDVADLRPVTPRPVAAPVQDVSAAPPAAAPAPVPVGVPTPDDLRAILADIRRVESTTDRRLVRLQASDGREARWAWKADLID